MPRERLLRQLALLIVGIVLVHVVATIFELYWNIWWLDIVLHVLGGLWVALALFWLLFYSNYAPRPARFSPAHALYVLAAMLLIAILWEAFEWSVGARFQMDGYWLDTYSDIACGFAGGLAGYLYFNRRFAPSFGS